MNEAGYQTLIVKFSEPITALDGIFDDAEAWGVDTLKGWIDSYVTVSYTHLAEKGYYNRIIAGNINQVLKVDSVVCDFNGYPYRAVTYATQKIIRQSNVTERSLVTTDVYKRQVQHLLRVHARRLPQGTGGA